MSLAGQIRGLLLEEFILHLLRFSGYRPVETEDNVTVFKGGSGLEVQGRGTRHQIDAIADYRLTHPFGYPQRLLVEGKCLKSPAGIEVLRNAAGVLKDVSEQWRGDGSNRFHYHYAVCCSCGFTPRAEEYAFAQDIYPIPLARSLYLRRVIASIWKIPKSVRSGRGSVETKLSEIRQCVREALRSGRGLRDHDLPEDLTVRDRIDHFLAEAQIVPGALLAVTPSGFLVMLVPPSDNQENHPETLANFVEQARQGGLRLCLRSIRTGHFWFLETSDGRRLFSLDIPPALFRKYGQGPNERRIWLNAKTHELQKLQIVWAPNGTDGDLQILHFNLSANWLHKIEQGLEQLRVSPRQT